MRFQQPADHIVSRQVADHTRQESKTKPTSKRDAEPTTPTTITKPEANLTIPQSHNLTISQSHNRTIAQSHSHTNTANNNDDEHNKQHFSSNKEEPWHHSLLQDSATLLDRTHQADKDSNKPRKQHHQQQREGDTGAGFETS